MKCQLHTHVARPDVCHDCARSMGFAQLGRVIPLEEPKPVQPRLRIEPTSLRIIVGRGKGEETRVVHS